MFPKSRDFKAQARAAMRGSMPNALLVTLVFLALTTLLSQLVGQFVPDPLDRFLTAASSGNPDLAIQYLLAGGGLGLFLSVVLMLYRLVMHFGYTVWSLRRLRGENCGYSALLDGFSMVGRVLLMELLIFLLVFAMVMGATFVMTMLTLFLVAAAEYMSGPLLIIPLVLAMIVFLGFVLFVMLRYSMVPFQLAHQPDQGASAAVRLGTRMLRGRMWSLIKLELSFLGWQLLAVLLFWGVGVGVVSLLGMELSPSGLLQDHILAVEMQVSSTPVAYWAATLVALPLLVWLSAYRSLSQAAFFQTLQAQAPPAGGPSVTYTRGGI